jgi:hypothetical protein
MEALATDFAPAGGGGAQERTVVPPLLRPHNKRNVLKRLPELINTPHFSNGNEQPRPVQTPTLFRNPNPLFVVNTLFQMLTEDVPPAEPRRKLEVAVDRRPQCN